MKSALPVLFFLWTSLLAPSTPQASARRMAQQRAIVVMPARTHMQQHAYAAAHLVVKRSPNTTQSNNYELDSERRALKKKRKRLRQLRDEVRQLSSHVHLQRAYQADGGVVIPGDGVLPDKAQRRKLNEFNTRWRKQMSSRVRMIMKRLKKLETGLKLGRSRTQTREKKRLMKIVKSEKTDKAEKSDKTGKTGKSEKSERNGAAVTRSIAIVTTTSPLAPTTTNIKIKRLHSSINQSKSGESGGVCISHKDCKPGLCCHRMTVSNDSVHATCRQHSLHEGDTCEDSCQCEARLHCFRSSPRLLTGAALVPLSGAVCKKVSTEDVVNGVYLNSKDSVFNTKRRRR